jgi:coproporphyrinogen III oxidase
VGFSQVSGMALPQSASARRPEIAGKPWSALGVSLVIHPRNPYVPTSHANVRFFFANADAGGADLVVRGGMGPDALLRLRGGRRPLAPHGAPRRGALRGAALRAHEEGVRRLFFPQAPRRGRGVGGLFFDDFDELGFERSFELLRSVGDAFIPAYRPIVARRKATPYGEREREHQLRRRGRYVEFNLLEDRGTLFGLQSGGRTESILMSLPPLVRWDYGARRNRARPRPASMMYFLKPRDWLGRPFELPNPIPRRLLLPAA